ncbi:MAG: Gfo/Idh/MocA family oxidoreductase [Chloroflexi bacterium OHK40]
MTTPRLRVGVIGAGIGAMHLKGYAHNPDVEIVALAGLDDERVRRAAAEFHVPKTYRHYEELLADERIEAVSVCLPNFLHAPVAIAALEAGKHVLVEKPLARNTAEGRAMAAAAAASGKVLMIAFNRRFRQDVLWLKRHIASGALGEIYYAKAFWMRRSGIPRLGSWFVNKAQAGGGPLVDLGVHVLDMALYLLGEPRVRAVSASTYAVFGPRGLKGWEGRVAYGDVGFTFDVEDLATAMIRLEGGATLHLEASWATHSSAADDFGVTLYGSEGGAELFVHNYATQNTLRLFTDLDGVPADTAVFLNSAEERLGIIDRFVDAVLGRGPADPGVAEGLQRTAVLEACYASAAAGRELPLDEG